MTTATLAAKLGVTEQEYNVVENLAIDDATYDWVSANSEGRWRLRSTANAMVESGRQNGIPLYCLAYARTVQYHAGES